MYAHNKHLLRATLIISALMPAALAAAADLPLPLPPPVPIWTWSGLYIGGQIGGYGGTSTFSDPFGPSIFGDKVNTSGFLAGLQLGYNGKSTRDGFSVSLPTPAISTAAAASHACKPLRPYLDQIVK